jgi:TolB-like protein
MAVLYGVTAWLVMQVAEVIIGLAALPEWIGQAILGVLAIGFPIALIFAWVYEITPQGIRMEKDVDRSESVTHVTGRRMDFIVIAMMAAALILFAYDKWWLSADKDIFAPPANSIAVLAFANMSPDPEQEFFSDGVSEELLNLLAQVPELKVIARTSSFSFKGEKADIATIAEKLNVRHVVEGSVRRSGDKVRITAQLIDTKDSTHVWSQTYDRELTEIIAVQDAIGKSIVEALKLRLPIDGVTLPKRVPRAASFEAYEVYLLGRHYLNQRGSDEAGRENIKAAIENFQKAIELDPGLAAAYADQALAVLSLSAFFVHNTPSLGGQGLHGSAVGQLRTRDGVLRPIAGDQSQQRRSASQTVAVARATWKRERNGRCAGRNAEARPPKLARPGLVRAICEVVRETRRDAPRRSTPPCHDRGRTPQPGRIPFSGGEPRRGHQVLPRDPGAQSWLADR